MNLHVPQRFNVGWGRADMKSFVQIMLTFNRAQGTRKRFLTIVHKTWVCPMCVCSVTVLYLTRGKITEWNTQGRKGIFSLCSNSVDFGMVTFTRILTHDIARQSCWLAVYNLCVTLWILFSYLFNISHKRCTIVFHCYKIVKIKIKV